MRRSAKDAGRKAYWAVAARVPHRHRTYPFPGGRIYLDLADSPAMVKRVLWLYERQKRRALTAALEPEMRFVDVGANIGDFSLIAARRVGPEGRVVAVEPHPGNCAMIERSAAANGYRNVTVRQVALGDADGHATLHLGERAAWHTLVAGLPNREAGAIDVRQMTLDSLLEELGEPPPHVVKIDVEGAEAAVLRGAQRTLSGRDDLVVLLDMHPHLGVDTAEIEALLAPLGFRFYAMDAPHTRIARPEPRAAELLARRSRPRRPGRSVPYVP